MESLWSFPVAARLSVASADRFGATNQTRWWSATAINVVRECHEWTNAIVLHRRSPSQRPQIHWLRLRVPTYFRWLLLKGSIPDVFLSLAFAHFRLNVTRNKYDECQKRKTDGPFNVALFRSEMMAFGWKKRIRLGDSNFRGRSLSLHLQTGWSNFFVLVLYYVSLCAKINLSFQCYSFYGSILFRGIENPWKK